ncbi:hypothetical protein ACFSC6_13850 [Rufibacter sediminis]|uniref:Uncharacterized protein n=1 Tax=Rufibacter sediminis TaxID=2762756 RepID=A0ABR6VYG7_9BACT|nr:hypothetical protein [Rufibacter sediminis]MBC3542277.1 hypothetical protein [Rufibacter sediminis]
MRFKDIQAFLENHSSLFGLVSLAEESCRKLLSEKTKNGHSEWYEYEFNDLVVRLIEQELVFNHTLRQTPHIRTRIGIYIEDPDNIYFMGLEPLGFYQLDTTDNGEIIDDWLVFDKQTKLD